MRIIALIRDNWETVEAIGAFVAYLSVSIANGLTKHFTGAVGARRFFLFMAESLSFLTSRDVKSKTFKLPLTTVVPPVGKVEPISDMEPVEHPAPPEPTEELEHLEPFSDDDKKTNV